VGRIKRVARLGLLAPPLRELIHHMKFHGRWELADWLGRRLALDTAVRRLLDGADAIVPVPLHAARQAHRGYNQAMQLARRLSRASGLPVLQPAVRARSTVAQTSLSSVVARQKNLRDAFVLLHPKMVLGRRLVLVDDVMTTGATLRSFGQCLWPGRPAGLSAVVAAIADPRGRGFQTV
jgi:ComF family protein